MSLIAVVENVVVEKMKLLTHDDILDGISLTTFLPGPISTNVVVYVGYRIKGIWGAFVSLFGVTLPSFVLVVALAILYFRVGEITTIHNMFLGFTPAVAAIILNTAWQMSRKTLTEWRKVTIAIIAALLLITVGGVYITTSIIIVSGVIGWLFLGKSSRKKSSRKILLNRQHDNNSQNYYYLLNSLQLHQPFSLHIYGLLAEKFSKTNNITTLKLFSPLKSKWYYQKVKLNLTEQNNINLNNYPILNRSKKISLFSLASSFLIFKSFILNKILAKKNQLINKKNFFLSLFLLPSALLAYFVSSLIFKKYIIIQVFVTFVTISVMLFGGAYVSIPLIQEIIVHDLNWLTQQEFTYGLAVGQITPGPIVISAAFIGYKVANIYGAIAATFGVFLPPFLLMIAGANLLELFKKSSAIQAAMNGIRPAVIGMIFAAFWIVGKTASPNWVSALIFFASLFALVQWRVNVIWIIPCVGLASILLYQ